MKILINASNGSRQRCRTAARRGSSAFAGAINIFCFVVLFFAGILISSAQTNTGTNAVDEILALVTTNPPTSPKPQRGPTVIEADGPADFDLNWHLVTYRDHVRVTDPQMKLTCEWLTANLPQGGEHVTNIVAKTNVVIDFTDEKGQKTHATGDKAVYSFHVVNGLTNETVTLTGNPRVEQAQVESTGDAIIWDRATGHVTFTNPRMVIQQNVGGLSAKTNSSIVKTNFPPPGTIQDIDQNIAKPAKP